MTNASPSASPSSATSLSIYVVSGSAAGGAQHSSHDNGMSSSHTASFFEKERSAFMATVYHRRPCFTRVYTSQCIFEVKIMQGYADA